jgi:hypothetical protein
MHDLSVIKSPSSPYLDRGFYGRCSNLSQGPFAQCTSAGASFGALREACSCPCCILDRLLSCLVTANRRVQRTVPKNFRHCRWFTNPNHFQSESDHGFCQIVRAHVTKGTRQHLGAGRDCSTLVDKAKPDCGGNCRLACDSK